MAIRGSRLIREIEQKHGRPLPRILVDALNDHETITRAAQSIGVKPRTFWAWMVRYNVRVDRRAFIA